MTFDIQEKKKQQLKVKQMTWLRNKKIFMHQVSEW